MRNLVAENNDGPAQHVREPGMRGVPARIRKRGRHRRHATCRNSDKKVKTSMPENAADQEHGRKQERPDPET